MPVPVVVWEPKVAPVETARLVIAANGLDKPPAVMVPVVFCEANCPNVAAMPDAVVVPVVVKLPITVELPPAMKPLFREAKPEAVRVDWKTVGPVFCR